MTKRNETLQALCRDYLGRLRYMAKKHGIDVDSIIRANKRKECEATNKEVEILSRCVDDERVSRTDVPKILGKSYRQSNEDGDFERIKKLKYQGIYSKVSALLYKSRKNPYNIWQNEILFIYLHKKIHSMRCVLLKAAKINDKILAGVMNG